MSSVWFYLMHNPNALDRLQQSIRSDYNSVDEIQYDAKLKGNSYLHACIDEALRLTPPVCFMPPREVCAGGATVAGSLVPQGTIIGVPFYALFHNKEYFAHPWEFRPSRWLSADEGGDGLPAEALARQRQAFVPFSVGLRGCIGKNLALMEMYVSVARVLFVYDVRLAPGITSVGCGANGEYHFKDYFVASQKEGPMIQLRTRQGVANKLS